MHIQCHLEPCFTQDALSILLTVYTEEEDTLLQTCSLSLILLTFLLIVFGIHMDIMDAIYTDLCFLFAAVLLSV